ARCSRETERQDTIPARASGSLSNTHAGLHTDATLLIWRLAHCAYRVEDPLSVNSHLGCQFVSIGKELGRREPAHRAALMEKDCLTLKRASASRSSGEWSDDDYDVLADDEVVGRIFKAKASPVGMSWMWTLAFGYHEDRTPTHGYEP